MKESEEDTADLVEHCPERRLPTRGHSAGNPVIDHACGVHPLVGHLFKITRRIAVIIVTDDICRSKANVKAILSSFSGLIVVIGSLNYRP